MQTKLSILLLLFAALLVGCRVAPQPPIVCVNCGEIIPSPLEHLAALPWMYKGINYGEIMWSCTQNWHKVYPLADKVAKRDGTNFLGVYMGMIAEWDGSTSVWDGTNMVIGRKPMGVQMFSATSGQLLKWISAEDFTNIFVLKNRPEYQ